ncbi:hypothetical protein GCM10027596_29540 [Nocardioides korecus]
MTYSRILSALTAVYGVFALVRPRHLADGLEAPAAQAPAYDQVARTYGGRDLAISALALSRNPQVVSAAMALRIVGDLSDATVLGTATSGKVRAKVLAVTLGWAALNTAAYAADRKAR